MVQYRFEVYDFAHYSDENHAKLDAMAAAGWKIHSASLVFTECSVLWERASAPKGEDKSPASGLVSGAYDPADPLSAPAGEDEQLRAERVKAEEKAVAAREKELEKERRDREKAGGAEVYQEQLRKDSAGRQRGVEDRAAREAKQARDRDEQARQDEGAEAQRLAKEAEKEQRASAQREEKDAAERDRHAQAQVREAQKHRDRQEQEAAERREAEARDAQRRAQGKS